GQLQQAAAAAQAALAINPKNNNAYTLLLVTQLQLNQLDSAMATAQKALANGADKQMIADALIGVVGPAVKKAQESKTREDWEAALKSAKGVDAIAPSANTKFYIGVSAFQIATEVMK